MTDDGGLVQPVEVVVSGDALPPGNGTADAPGWLRAWARDDGGWRGLVEWIDVRGLKHGSWFPAAALRPAAEPDDREPRPNSAHRPQ